jgi:hypothetical protein
MTDAEDIIARADKVLAQAKADGWRSPNPRSNMSDGDLPAGSWPMYPAGGFIGLTKREYFAGQALAGYLATSHQVTSVVAKACVDYADALLAELAKRPQ